jgi:hypothetical protein
MPPPNGKGLQGGDVPPDPKLASTLGVRKEDDMYEVIFDIPKEKGLEARGID